MVCLSLDIAHVTMHYMSLLICLFFNATATTEIYTLSLHDALPILVVDGDDTSDMELLPLVRIVHAAEESTVPRPDTGLDRKSTRLNSSHVSISYAVFCLKKKIITIYFAHSMTGISYSGIADHYLGS